MNVSRHPIKPAPVGGPSNRRRSGRLATIALWSDRGQVLDLSRGGLRLISKKRMEGHVHLRLFSHDGSVEVRGNVTWSKRIAFRKHDIGISFTNTTPQLIQRLLAIAQSHGMEEAA